MRRGGSEVCGVMCAMWNGEWLRRTSQDEVFHKKGLINGGSVGWELEGSNQRLHSSICGTINAAARRLARKLQHLATNRYSTLDEPDKIIIICP